MGMRFANEEADLAALMEQAMEMDAFMSLAKRERQRMRELMRLRSDKFVDRTLIGGVDIDAKGLGFDGTQPVEAYAF